MDIKTIVGPAADWSGQTWAQRIDQSASLLFLHGYITQSQRSKVTQKLEAQFVKGIAAGEIIERKEAP